MTYADERGAWPVKSETESESPEDLFLSLKKPQVLLKH
jgi:hypothetical protein